HSVVCGKCRRTLRVPFLRDTLCRTRMLLQQSALHALLSRFRAALLFYGHRSRRERRDLGDHSATRLFVPIAED
ncbi:MAG: hypothetical protein II380_08755, partial [Prevotella sp.]|nr:hypothetical protein [Prevotella sp.]